MTLKIEKVESEKKRSKRVCVRRKLVYLKNKSQLFTLIHFKVLFHFIEISRYLTWIDFQNFIVLLFVFCSV